MVNDFLCFRRMLTPWLIAGIFWIVVFFCIIFGLYDLFTGLIAKGLVVLLLGPIIIRIICECLMIFFRINETLTEIRNILSTHKP